MGAIADRDRTSASFGKSRRLLTASQYRAVFDDAAVKVSHRNLLLLARITDHPQSRLGLVIAKKNVRKAVQRNRIKRVARELFRQLPPA
ncbi:MAG: ribonuclease P protein component, partial [Haliea sp.]